MLSFPPQKMLSKLLMSQDWDFCDILKKIMINLKMNLFLRPCVLLAYELQHIPTPLDLYEIFFL